MKITYETNEITFHCIGDIVDSRDLSGLVDSLRKAVLRHDVDPQSTYQRYNLSVTYITYSHLNRSPYIYSQGQLVVVHARRFIHIALRCLRRAC